MPYIAMRNGNGMRHMAHGMRRTVALALTDRTLLPMTRVSRKKNRMYVCKDSAAPAHACTQNHSRRKKQLFPERNVEIEIREKKWK